MAMDKQSTIFTNEEKAIEEAQSVLNDTKYQNNELLSVYSILLKRYKRIYTQLRRLIKLGDSQQTRLNELNKKLDITNRFIRKAFGQYLSDEIVETILETPDGLQLGGEKSRATILMTDLRGFTAISERFPAEDVVKIINIYLERMTEIILKFNGTINEFIGDSILAVFGALLSKEDDAKRAVACALEMQLAMKEVNQSNIEAGYPKISMGIGINTGTVIMGNIGSSKRTKYGIVGQAVNLTSRIESMTVGGQILVSESTLNDCEGGLRIDGQIDIRPKGVRELLSVYEVGGIGDPFNVFLPVKNPLMLIRFSQPIPVKFSFLDGKSIIEQSFIGKIVRLRDKTAEIEAERSCREMSDLKIVLLDDHNKVMSSDLYGKVSHHITDDPPTFRVIFTSIDPAAKVYLENITGNPLFI